MAKRINQTFRKMPELKAELALFIKDIAGTQGQAGEEIKDVLRDAAEPIAESARKNINSITGNLAKSVFASRGDKRKPTAIVGVNFSIAPYANAVEFGHVGPRPAPPHPFMRPAVATNRASTRAIIAAGVERIVDKYK